LLLKFKPIITELAAIPAPPLENCLAVIQEYWRLNKTTESKYCDQAIDHSPAGVRENPNLLNDFQTMIQRKGIDIRWPE